MHAAKHLRNKQTKVYFWFSFRELGADSKRHTKVDIKSDHRSASPTGKRTSPTTLREPGFLCAHKPSHQTPSPAPSLSPMSKKRRAKVVQKSPALKVNAKDEPEDQEDMSSARKSKKGHSAHAMSPKEGRSLFVRNNHNVKNTSTEAMIKYALQRRDEVMCRTLQRKTKICCFLIL